MKKHYKREINKIKIEFEIYNMYWFLLREVTAAFQ